MVFKKIRKVSGVNMFLDDNTFKNIIRNTPLISIDLIIQNEKGEYLVGKETTAPQGALVCSSEGAY
ncbi:hypothetical protein LNP26_19895 [Klebsiella variicola subsp. variicola]|nr:hypothetical protein [Klebsiella variicola subsp. variicola]